MDRATKKWNMKRAFVAGLAVSLAAGFAAPRIASAQGQLVRYWGTEFSGAVGADLVYTELTPTAVSIPDAAALVQVGSSNSTEYALLGNGTVWAWGIGAEGQLGNDTTTAHSASPVQVEFPVGVTIRSLATDAMPFDAGLAIDTNGNAWGWGFTGSGVLCKHGTGVPTRYLLPVKLPLTDVSLVAGASGHAIFDSNGSLFACGGVASQYPALGTGLDAAAYTPTPVVGMQGVHALGVYATSMNSFALLGDGQVWSWGANNAGQLGDGTEGGSSSVPVMVGFSDSSPVVQHAAGGEGATDGSVLVRLADGTYWAWGDDYAGQLGNGRTSNQPSPIEFSPPAGVAYALLAANAGDGYAVTAAGDVWAWGANSGGQLGNGGRGTGSRVPVKVITGGITMISATASDVVVG